MVHLWGGDGCGDIFKDENLTSMSNLLGSISKRNQRLILRAIRKAIQTPNLAGTVLYSIIRYVSIFFTTK